MVIFSFLLSCSKNEITPDNSGNDNPGGGSFIWPDEDAIAEEIKFKWHNVRMVVDSTLTIPLKEIMYDDGSSIVGSDIDPTTVEWRVKDKSMAKITSGGRITALKTGMTKVYVEADGIEAEIPVYITTGASTTGIGTVYGTGNIYDRKQKLEINQLPQGFDITSDGSLYYLGIDRTKVHRLTLNKVTRNTTSSIKTTYSESMHFDFFGHGTNYAIEESGGKKYIWLATYGSRQDDGYYWNEQVIGRFEYKNGTTVRPEDAVEYIYFSTWTDSHIAIDAANDQIMIYYATADAKKPRHFAIYSLKEALKAPVRPITLSPRTYGGGTSSASSVTDAPVVMAHDLRQIEKITDISFQGVPQAEKWVANGGRPSDPEAFGYYAYQGFELHDGAIYFYEGGGQKTGSTPPYKSDAYITVMNFAGQVIEKRTRVKAVDDASGYFTNKGYMEGEGLKVRNGKLYVCFGSFYDSNRVANILSYTPAKLY